MHLRTTTTTTLSKHLISPRRSPLPIHTASTRQFSISHNLTAQNRIYDSVRNSPDFQTLLLLSSSSHQPLLTLWTASWAPLSAPTVSLLTRLISVEKIGQDIRTTDNLNHAIGGDAPVGVGFAEIEADAPDIVSEGLVARYGINKVPMLLAFSRGEAQIETRVWEEEKLRDEGFLREWIEREAARGGGGGAGGVGGGGLFGWLWGR